MKHTKLYALTCTLAVTLPAHTAIERPRPLSQQFFPGNPRTFEYSAQKPEGTYVITTTYDQGEKRVNVSLNGTTIPVARINNADISAIVNNLTKKQGVDAGIDKWTFEESKENN